MRKIMMISEHASPLSSPGAIDCGGQNVYVKYLAGKAADYGLFVDVYTRKDHPDQPDIVQAGDGVRVMYVPAGPPEYLPKENLLPHIPEFAHYCAAVAAKQGYDLVHAHYFMSGIVAGELQWRLGLPFVVTFHALGRVRRRHQAEADRFTDDRFLLEDAVIEQADGIIAECPQDAQDLTTLYGADPAKISIIPCGVDMDVFYVEDKAVARKRLGLDSSLRVLLHVGRLVPRKGVDNIIRAFSFFTERELENTQLIIVGGESDFPDPEVCPEMGRLMDLAAELKVAKAVRFVGRKEPEMLRWYYSAADLFITTPWYEPFGITPLEAMACGTPVIGSCVGGIKFSVQDGITGSLVPPREPGSLVSAMRRLLDRPEILKQYSAAARERVRQMFTWDRVAALMLPFYRQAALSARRTSNLKTVNG